MFEMYGKYTNAKIMIDEIDQSTASQIQEMINHPAATNPVAIMPDTHAGKGCVIGFTMKTSDKIVPNWIGVDVGCGMISIKTNLKEISENILKSLDERIRHIIPMGMSVNNNCHKYIKSMFISLIKNESINCPFLNIKQFQNINEKKLSDILDAIGMSKERFWNSLGTLGGGNHFIEIGKDEEGLIWITVHTGSRNFGKTVCEYFDKKAQSTLNKNDTIIYAQTLRDKAKRGEIEFSEIEKLVKKRKQETKYDFNIKTSAFLSGDDVNEYLSFMFLAQIYAQFNRKLIIDQILDSLSIIIDGKISIDEKIESIHNFIDFEDNTIRKGAIRSYLNEKIILPFNMRDGLLICEGKSNPEWNYSAPHGAGRVLSRRGAKDNISIEEYKKSMEGIFTTSVGMDTIDESPMAYKEAKIIENAIEPTAKILHRVKPIYNVKAGENK